MTSESHLLLNAQVGWQAAQISNISFENTPAAMQLTTLPDQGIPLMDQSGSFGGLSTPTGLAVGPNDQIYILDGKAHLVKRFDPCQGLFETLPCIGTQGYDPRQLQDPQDLAIASNGDLLITDTGNRRVQIFTEKGLALRSILGPFQVHREGSAIWLTSAAVTYQNDDISCSRIPNYPTGTWQPWGITLSCQNWSYISDYANGLVHVFDSCGFWRKALTGEGTDAEPFEKPTHLVLDKHGHLYVVQEGKDFVTVLSPDGEFLERITFSKEAKGRFCPLAIGIDDNGNLFISERFSCRIHIVCTGVGQQYLGTCRSFNGLGLSLAFDKEGNPLVASAEQSAVVKLQAKASHFLEGEYYSEALDSRIHDCQWHKVVLRAALEPGSQIRVSTFTSTIAKSNEEIQSLPESRWTAMTPHTTLGEGEWDGLIQSLSGRYLWLRLSLYGDGQVTPVIEQIRVYFPRASSMQYLPAIYQKNPSSGEFLGRFLSIFDTLQKGISHRLNAMPKYFDPEATPAEPKKAGEMDFLSWLASWLGLALERRWPEERRRQLVKHAHRLYKLRGTPEGLSLHLELYTGLKPNILEHFKLRRWFYLNQGRLGDVSTLWGDAVVKRLQLDNYSRIGDFQLIDSSDPLHDPFYQHAHRFTVFVPLRQEATETDQKVIERIIDLAKPAHTLGQVQIVRPRFRVGIQSFVGVDTAIGAYPASLKEGEGQLGYDTVLGPSVNEAKPPSLRVGIRSRIGSSTLLN